jgi:subtilisin-like proprotein convertase family protein
MKAATALLTLGLLAGVPAHAAVYTFNQTVNAAIPDANPNGLSSTFTVSGVTDGLVSDVNVMLNVSGTWNGDLYAYLSHGTTGFAVLLNRVGRTSLNPFGSADTGVNIWLDDSASTDVHLAGGTGSLLTGTYQADGRSADPQFVTDASARDARLSSFENLNPNGTWTLFFADAAGQEQSTLEGWSLQLTVIPEPIHQALMIFGLILVAGAASRRWRRARG